MDIPTITPPTATELKKIRCLVIQLSRLGDTLQSLMALRAAKQLYPQLEIHFLARDRFAAAAKRVPWLSSVTTLPVDALVAPVISRKKQDHHALRDVAKWTAPLIKDRWDFVINWSYSETSSYLCALLPSRVKLGYSRRPDGTMSSVDGWSHYIQAVVQGGVNQNIHLTDVLTTQLLTALQIHAGDPADEGNSPVTSKGFFQLEIGERDLITWRDMSRKWIGLQLGSSQADKSWPVEKWAALAAQILRRNPECSIVLLGDERAEPEAKKILAILARQKVETKHLLSLVGKTDFDLWASIVGRCNWMVTCDSAAIHLASVLGTRVLNVSVGPTKMAENGPYGNGHFIVASNLNCEPCSSARGEGGSGDAKHTCREDVTSESVYAVWSYAVAEWARRGDLTIEAHFQAQGWDTLLPAIRVYRSRVRDTEDGGGVNYESVIQRALLFSEWSAQMMGHIARAWYCGWVPAIGTELPRANVSPALVQSLRKLDECGEILGRICQEAVGTSDDLNKKASRLRSARIMQIADKEEMQQMADRLRELDGLIERLGNLHEPVKGFSHLLQVMMHNLRANELAGMSRESNAAYRQLQSGGSIMKDWVAHTLELAKPVSIRRLNAVPSPTV